MSKTFRTGWIPDYPDRRDYTVGSDTVQPLLQRIGIENIASVNNIPDHADISDSCSPIEHQGTLGACSAHAAIGLVEFFERRTFGEHLDASPRFLYKVTRKLTGTAGDCGASLRDTMKALALFGVPSEKSWPYVPEAFDEEPTAFHYALAQNYQAEVYYRLDSFDSSLAELLHCIKVHLANNLPVAFGFTTYPSIGDVGDGGIIPFPYDNEAPADGHAIVAVGYEDGFEVENPVSGTDAGALYIRNSWGTDWGDGGYGWLPYDYVLSGLTRDWWCLLRNEWLDTDAFGSQS